MNFAHSFWSKPLLNCKFNRFEEQLKIILTDYLLSFITIKDNGYDVTLYTDKIGADILSIINYDHIEIIENSITDDYNFAASIKFCALERMPLEDTLIDGIAFFKKVKFTVLQKEQELIFYVLLLKGKMLYQIIQSCVNLHILQILKNLLRFQKLNLLTVGIILV